MVRLHGATAYPVDDLALGRTVFPTSPLPAGMSAPSAAVDGDPGSSWRPGKDGRLVVDLGAALPVREIEAEWTGGDVPGLRVEGSTDGIAYRDWGRASGHGRTRALRVRETARYVAVRVDGGDGRRAARLVRLSVR
ncbi:F5/8 type C domain-containing protein [Streptomyces sp. SolWspMP-sol7th]|nr:F5/8 type C domain-containing protein [Streptomyces sp. SolWspMP-sol7th]